MTYSLSYADFSYIEKITFRILRAVYCAALVTSISLNVFKQKLVILFIKNAVNFTADL